MEFFEFVLALIAMFMVFFILTARTVSRRDRRFAKDDTELIQELHQGLQRMAQRIETLETLLLDRAPEREARADHARASGEREWR
jgi:phage shock protein B